jgi:hypothetical protein
MLRLTKRQANQAYIDYVLCQHENGLKIKSKTNWLRSKRIIIKSQARNKI